MSTKSEDSDKTIQFQISGTDLPSLPTDPPVVWGNYEVHERIGNGGMAIVHRAIRLTDKLEVALKLLTKPNIIDPYWRTLQLRFKQEAGITERLASNKNIVQIYDSGVFANGCEFIAMELLRGGTLDQAKSRFKQEYKKSAEFVMRIARAVSTAHSFHIVHRDLTLRNVMFRTTAKKIDDIVLTDFGLATNWLDTLRLTSTGTFLGTPNFASPEQLQNAREVKEPTDVFSLGVILFCLVTGEYPFQEFRGQISQRHINDRLKETPKNLVDTSRRLGFPSCPVDLSNICYRCLIPVAKGRIKTAAELAYELEEFIRK